jgi:hypothetical protein
VQIDVCHSVKVVGKVKVEAGALPINRPLLLRDFQGESLISP